MRRDSAYDPSLAMIHIYSINRISNIIVTIDKGSGTAVPSAILRNYVRGGLRFPIIFITVTFTVAVMTAAA